MRRWAVVLSAISISLGAATTVAGTAIADPPDNDPYTLSNGHAEAGNAGGVVQARGAAHDSKPRGGGTPNLFWHGGGVRSAGTTVFPVFWGTSWQGNNSNPTVAAMDTFYQGVGGTPYMNTTTEYTDGGGTAPSYVGNPASNAVSYGGSNLFNGGAAPSSSPSTGSVLNAVVAATGGHPLAGAYYPVYADTTRGNAGFCAWHSTGSYNGVQFQFGFFWKMDTDPGCDPGSSNYAGHPQGVAALGNVSGHELSEMTTDPQLNAWFDQQGNENSDKCAWTFNGPLTFSNGSTWVIQGNWSNNAYNHAAGYAPYANGGCITTH